MKKSRNHLVQLKPGHFILAIITFSFCVIVISDYKMKNMPETGNKEEHCFKGHVAEKGYNVVFFYEDKCQLCNKMRYNLEQSKMIDNAQVNYIEVDINEYPHLSREHRIAGIPNTLIFDGSKEIKRIFGIVSKNNLNKIQTKIIGS